MPADVRNRAPGAPAICPLEAGLALARRRRSPAALRAAAAPDPRQEPAAAPTDLLSDALTGAAPRRHEPASALRPAALSPSWERAESPDAPVRRAVGPPRRRGGVDMGALLGGTAIAAAAAFVLAGGPALLGLTPPGAPGMADAAAPSAAVEAAGVEAAGVQAAGVEATAVQAPGVPAPVVPAPAVDMAAAPAPDAPAAAAAPAPGAAPDAADPAPATGLAAADSAPAAAAPLSAGPPAEPAPAGHAARSGPTPPAAPSEAAPAALPRRLAAAPAIPVAPGLPAAPAAAAAAAAAAASPAAPAASAEPAAAAPVALAAFAPAASAPFAAPAALSPAPGQGAAPARLVAAARTGRPAAPQEEYALAPGAMAMPFEAALAVEPAAALPLFAALSAPSGPDLAARTAPVGEPAGHMTPPPPRFTSPGAPAEPRAGTEPLVPGHALAELEGAPAVPLPTARPAPGAPDGGEPAAQQALALLVDAMPVMEPARSGPLSAAPAWPLGAATPVLAAVEATPGDLASDPQDPFKQAVGAPAPVPRPGSDWAAAVADLLARDRPAGFGFGFGPRIVIQHAPGAEDVAAALREVLRGAGHEAVELRPTRDASGPAHLRFFHEADRERAAAVAARLGALPLEDHGAARPAPREGLIEVRLGGSGVAGSDPAPAPKVDPGAEPGAAQGAEPAAAPAAVASGAAAAPRPRLPGGVRAPSAPPTLAPGAPDAAAPGAPDAAAAGDAASRAAGALAEPSVRPAQGE
ncbi:hypothetical protein ACQ5SO_13705 [Rhodovulum sp. DZ06]|uniref:hypothetical protein n=1 Tax=Rhodovulum sp. DZ06 TaxID=3425126 RepID=UPI003D33AD12